MASYLRMIATAIAAAMCVACGAGGGDAANSPPVGGPSPEDPVDPKPLPTMIANGPHYRVTPTAATASASEPGRGADAVYDYARTESTWSAGSFAPESLTLDL